MTLAQLGDDAVSPLAASAVRSRFSAIIASSADVSEQREYEGRRERDP
jgi:hypothetical protein